MDLRPDRCARQLLCTAYSSALWLTVRFPKNRDHAKHGHRVRGLLITIQITCHQTAQCLGPPAAKLRNTDRAECLDRPDDPSPGNNGPRFQLDSMLKFLPSTVV